MIATARKTARRVLDRWLQNRGLTVVPMGRSAERSVDDVRALAAAMKSAFGLMVDVTPERGDRLIRLIGTGLAEGLWILDSLARTAQLDGDVCEFGVAQGATSTLLAGELQETSKTLWLYDTFAGLPPPTSQDKLLNDIFQLGSMEAYTGTMNCPRSMVENKLKEIDFSQYRVVEGRFDETTQTGPNQISFAYVDFDFYKGIIDALRFIDKRIVADGIIMVDDYDWFSSGAKTAIQEFIGVRCAYKMFIPDKSFGHFAILRKSEGGPSMKGGGENA